MSAVQILQLVLELVQLLKSSGMLTNGKLNVDLSNLPADANFVANIGALLQKHNVAVPEQVGNVLEIVKLLTQ